MRLESVPLCLLARLSGRPRRHLRELLHMLYDVKGFLSCVVLLAAHNFIQIFYCAQLAQFIHLHFLLPLGGAWSLQFPADRALNLDGRGAVRALLLPLPLHPALSLALRVELDHALRLAPFIQSSARKGARDDLKELVRMAPPTLHSAPAPSRARFVILQPGRLHNSELVDIEQEQRALLHALAALMLLEIIIANCVLQIHFFQPLLSNRFILFYDLVLLRRYNRFSIYIG